ALACMQGAGCEVVLISRREETINHGLELIESGPFGLQGAVRKAKLTQDRATELRELVSGTTDYQQGLAGADLVFESIPEVVDAKLEALSRAEEALPDGVPIATNTSSIMISELAGALTDPGRLVGTHWFYPSNVMRLVEVVRGNRTSNEALQKVVGFLGTIGKKPVVVGDAPGFFMTRFINLFIMEAINLVEIGVAGPREIDEMLKAGLGWPMGVFELLDETASFDSWYHAQEYLFETLGERYAIPPLARKVFRAGYRA
ncbi:MAG: 3-hydroxyacyl-CoA dehydrogenase family protein, partial [Actinobacteria bacterium]|nr:3-hydroxyacyl-CoA dehydrogenase family protein [Actinomycetota bacterium]